MIGMLMGEHNRIYLIGNHLDRMQSFYGPELGLVLFRKHANQYITPQRITRAQRQTLLTAETKADFLIALDTIYA